MEHSFLSLHVLQSEVFIIINDSTAFVRPWPLFHFRNPIDSRWDSLDEESAQRKAATYTQDIQTSMPLVGFEPTIPVFELLKTVHTSDRTDTVIGQTEIFLHSILVMYVVLCVCVCTDIMNSVAASFCLCALRVFTTEHLSRLPCG
jgi:hypothetical protein